jgi:hypothetical protein
MVAEADPWEEMNIQGHEISAYRACYLVPTEWKSLLRCRPEIGRSGRRNVEKIVPNQCQVHLGNDAKYW